jgi:hypothetical protein
MQILRSKKYKKAQIRKIEEQSRHRHSMIRKQNFKGKEKIIQTEGTGRSLTHV